MLQADFVVDVQYGDCGKGAITHHLASRKTEGKHNKYTHVLRFNGGGNAGHTIYHNGRKFVTHLVPSGVFHGIKSIIGCGCVVDPIKLQEEINDLNSGGINTDGLVFIAKNAHMVLPEHKEEDSKDTTIGTTKTGNGPAYRNKYNRTGITAEKYAEENPWMKPFLVDLYEELHRNKIGSVRTLCEGAQGFGIDVDWGDYPYVTSSHCTTAGALLNGIPPQATREVWGAAKAYETYVGEKKFQPDDEIFNIIQEVGQEIGATTGRKRKCNWLDINHLEKAVRINGVTHLVVSKMDVLQQVGKFGIISNQGEVITSNDISLIYETVNSLYSACPTIETIHYSFSPDKSNLD